jgi:hypothetical protein
MGCLSMADDVGFETESGLQQSPFEHATGLLMTMLQLTADMHWKFSFGRHSLPMQAMPPSRDSEGEGEDAEGAAAEVSLLYSDKKIEASDVSGVVLMTQYYLTGNAEYQDDLLSALRRNLANPHISYVYMLCEETEAAAHLEKLSSLNALPFSTKLRLHVLGRRLRFRQAFEFAQRELVGCTILLANSDIFFDNSLERVLGDTRSLDLQVSLCFV